MAPAVRIENVSKLYFLGARRQRHYRTLRESLTDVAAGPWRRWQTMRKQSRVMAHEFNGNTVSNFQQGANGHAATNGHASSNGHVAVSGQALPDKFWALKDVSFDVEHGEVVGIIGRNGAGKSTLLKILSRITEPTCGRITLNGRVASLLEVGTGFHPELTGRENIYLNGAILGMHRHEIKRKFDAIVDFSGVETFLDTPVKRYSSGMYVRLAFAVAAHLDPEILIVDEVLAVGDAEFQKKCLGKMHDVARSGRTVLFVSHNMAAVSALCPRAIVFTKGHLSVDAETQHSLQFYLAKPALASDAKFNLASHKRRTGTGGFQFTSVSISDGGAKSNNGRIPMDEDLLISMEYVLTSPVQHCNIGFHIVDQNGTVVYRVITRDSFGDVPLLSKSGTVTCRIHEPRLLPGNYWLALVCSLNRSRELLDQLEDAAHFEIVSSDVYRTGSTPQMGLVFARPQWQFEPTVACPKSPRLSSPNKQI